MKRSIYLDDDPFALTIEEKAFRAAKITCVVLAGAALSLSILDLMNVKSVETASEFIRTHSIGRLPGALGKALSEMAMAEPSPYVAVAIPRGTIALGPAVADRHDARMRAALEHDLAPLDALSDAPYQDAVDVAMDAPPVPAPSAAKLRPAASTDATSNEKSPALAAAAQARADASLSPDSEPPAHAPDASMLKLASLNTGDVQQTLGLPPPVQLPAFLSILPRPAPPMSPAQRLNLSGKARAHAEACLARAIYFEARDQPYRGQVAVAQVVINRVFSGIYPRDVCKVIYQNAHHYLGCQFTFACDGKPDIVRERRPWLLARRIARKTLDGKLYVQAVGTATHYHATYVHPYWVHEMRRYAREGIHLFYRPRAWGNGSNEPIWSVEELAANKYDRRRR